MIRTRRTLKNGNIRGEESFVKEEKHTAPSMTLKLTDSLLRVCDEPPKATSVGDTWHMTHHT